MSRHLTCRGTKMRPFLWEPSYRLGAESAARIPAPYSLSSLLSRFTSELRELGFVGMPVNFSRKTPEISLLGDPCDFIRIPGHEGTPFFERPPF